MTGTACPRCGRELDDDERQWRYHRACNWPERPVGPDEAPPHAGYWLVRCRLGQGKWGPTAPARIVRLQTAYEPSEPDNKMDRSSFWAAFVSGLPVSPWAILHVKHSNGDRILRVERTITRTEYDRLMAKVERARSEDRYLPMAVPFQDIARRQVAIPFLSGAAQ